MISWMVRVILRLLESGWRGCFALVRIINRGGDGVEGARSFARSSAGFIDHLATRVIVALAVSPLEFIGWLDGPRRLYQPLRERQSYGRRGVRDAGVGGGAVLDRTKRCIAQHGVGRS